MSLGTPNPIRVFAGEASATNLVNNGDFGSYAAGLEQLQNTGYGLNSHPQLVDQRQYRVVEYGFPVPQVPGESPLGFWDISGAQGSCDIVASPESRDGGNVLAVSFLNSGSIVLEQRLSNPLGVGGSQITASLGGYHIAGAVGVSLDVMYQGVSPLVAEAVSATTWASAASAYAPSTIFGAYRRVRASGDVPRALEYLLRITLVGHAGAVVGISGVVAGHAATSRWVPSIADTAMPTNTVILYAGTACPAGYASMGADRTILLTGGDPTSSGTQYANLGGQDTHDHNPGASKLETGPPVTSTVSTKLFSEVAKHAGEKPVRVLGPQHKHALDSSMTSVPPSFPLLICRKL